MATVGVGAGSTHPARIPGYGVGGRWGEVLIVGSLCFLQLLMQGPYVQGDFSELGTVCFLSLKTPS